MGIDNVDKLENNNFQLESYGNNYGVSFVDDKLNIFEEYIYETLKKDFGMNI